MPRVKFLITFNSFTSGAHLKPPPVGGPLADVGALVRERGQPLALAEGGPALAQSRPVRPSGLFISSVYDSTKIIARYKKQMLAGGPGCEDLPPSAPLGGISCHPPAPHVSVAADEIFIALALGLPIIIINICTDKEEAPCELCVVCDKPRLT